jgi:hypothetical protein
MSASHSEVRRISEGLSQLGNWEIDAEVLKMRTLRFVLLLGLLAIPAAFAHSQVAVGIGVGPVVAPIGDYAYGAPACAYGYYPYYPYACSPYGYYGPSWFAGGIFIGAGPWYRGYYGRGPWGGYGHGYYGGYGRGGYYGGAGFHPSATPYRGGYAGARPAYGGGGFNGAHPGNGFVGGGGHAVAGGGFHGGNVGGGGGFHGGGFGGGGGFHGGGGGGFHGGGGGGHR